MIVARIVDELEELEAYVPAWDALAVAAARPYCAPAWLLAWWRHDAPPRARLRVVVVLEGEELVGLAPFYGQPVRGRSERLGLLGSGASNRVQPLAHHGRAVTVAGAATAALADRRPRPALVHLTGVDGSGEWPELLAGQWPGRARPWLRVVQRTPAPTVDLGEGDYDEWLAAKSSNFRQQMRRSRRRLEAAGGRLRRVSATDEVVARVPEMLALHRGRMRAKGQRSNVNASVQRMLAAAAAELVPRERMWLWTVQAPDGRAISSHLFVAAGGEVAYWLGGFDDAWADAKPGLVVLLSAIEDAFATGARRVDLGAGGQGYKRRLAGGADELVEAILVPRGARYPLTRVQLGALEGRRRLALQLSGDRKRALRRMVGRWG